MSVPVVGVTTRKSGWRLLPEIPATRFSVSGSLRPKLGLLILLVILIVSTALILIPFVTSRLVPPGQSSPPPHLGLQLHKFLSAEADLEDQKNFASSPILASLSLISLVAVTGGETKRQLIRLLGSGDLSMGVDKYPSAFKGVYTQLYVDKRWDVDGRMGAIKEDFSKPNQARFNINSRLKKSTIRKMVGMELRGIGENTDMAVISAFDLKARWNVSRGKSEPRTFYVSKDVMVEVPMWTQVGVAKSLAGLDCVAVVLTLDAGMSLIVLMPNEKGQLQKVEQKLGTLSVKSFRRLSGDEVNLVMPGFTAEAEVDLAKFFKAEGVTEIFDETRIETNISKDYGLALNKVIHKVKVNLLENNGEENSAAVGTGGTLRTVTCNHPFIFLIIDNNTGVLLFTGRVVNPEKK